MFVCNVYDLCRFLISMQDSKVYNGCTRTSAKTLMWFIIIIWDRTGLICMFSDCFAINTSVAFTIWKNRRSVWGGVPAVSHYRHAIHAEIPNERVLATLRFRKCCHPTLKLVILYMHGNFAPKLCKNRNEEKSIFPGLLLVSTLCHLHTLKSVKLQNDFKL